MLKRLFAMLLPTVAAGLALSGEAEAGAYYGYSVSHPQYVRMGTTYMLVFAATKPGAATYWWASDQNDISHEYVKDFVMTAVLTGKKISVQCGMANQTSCDFVYADVMWSAQVFSGMPVWRVGSLKFDE